MKKLFILVVFGLLAGEVYGQRLNESEVPAAVKSAFAKAYPKVGAVKWEMEKESFEAGFQQNKKEMSVVLNSSGVVLEEELALTRGELPTAVLAMLTKDFAKFKIKETAKITARGVVTYEAEVEMGEESYDLVFDGDGKLLKKTKKDEEKN